MKNPNYPTTEQAYDHAQRNYVNHTLCEIAKRELVLKYQLDRANKEKARLRKLLKNSQL